MASRPSMRPSTDRAAAPWPFNQACDCGLCVSSIQRYGSDTTVPCSVLGTFLTSATGGLTTSAVVAMPAVPCRQAMAAAPAASSRGRRSRWGRGGVVGMADGSRQPRIRERWLGPTSDAHPTFFEAAKRWTDRARFERFAEARQTAIEQHLKAAGHTQALRVVRRSPRGKLRAVWYLKHRRVRAHPLGKTHELRCAPYAWSATYRYSCLQRVR